MAMGLQLDASITHPPFRFTDRVPLCCKRARSPIVSAPKLTRTTTRLDGMILSILTRNHSTVKSRTSVKTVCPQAHHGSRSGDAFLQIVTYYACIWGRCTCALQVVHDFTNDAIALRYQFGQRIQINKPLDIQLAFEALRDSFRVDFISVIKAFGVKDATHMNALCRYSWCVDVAECLFATGLFRNAPNLILSYAPKIRAGSESQ